MNNKLKDFGLKLKKIRESKNITQFEVETLSYISEKTVSRLERGVISDASIYSLIELSKLYNRDLVSLYISTVYGNYSLLKSIEKKLDMNSMFMSKKQIDSYIDQLKIIRSKRDLQNSVYYIDLLLIFLSYLKNDSIDSLRHNFDYLSSNIINNKNILSRSLSSIELRILINICSNFEEYKSFSSKKIIDNCIKQLEGEYLLIMALNSRANIEYINKNYKNALKYVYKAIDVATDKKSIEGLSYLYYTKFICEYKLSYKTYEHSLLSSKVFAENSNNNLLSNLINKKTSKILN